MALAIVNFLVRWPLILVLLAVQLYFLAWFLFVAYELRMYPLKDFGSTIHEFDPWFNYRATEYLAEHGKEKFYKWYDYMSWYPLGRPIGTTIYPGMQFTAVGIYKALEALPAINYEVPKQLRVFVGRVSKHLRSKGWIYAPYAPKTITIPSMKIIDVCCWIGPWFGSLASLFCGLMSYEVSRSTNGFLMTVGVMSVIPAHLMRSVGGKFDNEAIAMAAICSTFWLWLRSVRTPQSWPFGVLAGLSYFYMVAAWGGYIFVLNMIGVHALMLVGLGRFNSGAYKAYTLFYIVGTYGAIQIPVVGWTPLRSLEQLGPMGVFFGYQVLAWCDAQRRKQKMDAKEFATYRFKAFAILGAVLMVIIWILIPTGYFGPLSSRIRGLFMKHTKTGNPLVDSVAEHQPATRGIYHSYLNMPLDYVWFGALVCISNRNNGAYFLALYGFIAVHFSGKMSRLILICAPIVSAVCGIWLGWILDFILDPLFLFLGKSPPVSAAVVEKAEKAEKEVPQEPQGKAKKKPEPQAAKGKKNNGKRQGSSTNDGSDWPLEEWEEDYRPGGMAQMKRVMKNNIWHSFQPEQLEDFTVLKADWLRCAGRCAIVRPVLAVVMLIYVLTLSGASQRTLMFLSHCDNVARSMSNAQVKYKGGNGEIIDDPWAGYRWLADNTPKDARVMAWWDYGYQITGIGERTSLADGNTWNHEQIATLGRLLSGPQKKSHNVIRNLADYILIWAKKDLEISTHFARIGNSVFPDHCGNDDPFCSKYGFHNNDRNQPTPMMKKSLVFNLVKHGEIPGIGAHPTLFEEVHFTKNKILRIFKVLNVSQESKAWVADPENKICDAPGSWYCVGQYPPVLDKFINSRRSFSQVEDFNKKGEKSAYTKMIEKQRHGGGKEL